MSDLYRVAQMSADSTEFMTRLQNEFELQKSLRPDYTIQKFYSQILMLKGTHGPCEWALINPMLEVMRYISTGDLSPLLFREDYASRTNMIMQYQFIQRSVGWDGEYLRFAHWAEFQDFYVDLLGIHILHRDEMFSLVRALTEFWDLHTKSEIVFGGTMKPTTGSYDRLKETSGYEPMIPHLSRRYRQHEENKMRICSLGDQTEVGNNLVKPGSLLATKIVHTLGFGDPNMTMIISQEEFDALQRLMNPIGTGYSHGNNLEMDGIIQGIRKKYFEWHATLTDEERKNLLLGIYPGCPINEDGYTIGVPEGFPEYTEEEKKAIFHHVLTIQPGEKTYSLEETLGKLGN